MAKDYKLLARDIKQLEKMFKTHITQKFPRQVGQAALDTFDESWEQQGFESESGVKKWKARKSRRTASDKNRKILVGKGSGTLRRSLKIVSATAKRVIVGTPVPYAQIHNEGGVVKQSYTTRRGTRVNRTIEMPQRQFMGATPALLKQIKKILDEDLPKLQK